MPLHINDSSVQELAEQVRIWLGARTETEAIRATLRARARERLGPPVRGSDKKQVMDEV